MARTYITFSQFKTDVKSVLWPDIGEPQNMTEVHNTYILDCLIDLQRWMPSLQQSHIDRYQQSDTFWTCGMSTFEAPRGTLARLYTVGNDDECDRVDYVRCERSELEAWLKEYKCGRDLTFPETPYPPSPYGLYYADDSTDATCGRATSGLWAVHGGSIFVAPYIQSDETIVLEWSGIKRHFSNGDLVWDDADIKSTVRAYLQMQIAKHWKRDSELFLLSKAEYEDKRADLMHEERNEAAARNPISAVGYSPCR